jgi:hypothetical protein
VKLFAAGWLVLSAAIRRRGSGPGADGRHVDEFDAVTDHVAPWRSTAIGADSTPRNVPIMPDSAAIGPPAAPLAIAVIASRCSAVARASVTSPTDLIEAKPK